MDNFVPGQNKKASNYSRKLISLKGNEFSLAENLLYWIVMAHDQELDFSKEIDFWGTLIHPLS